MKRIAREGTPKGAFTLIELLVVIAIIAILAAILLPVLSAARLRAQTAQCMNNYRQMGIAWVMYINDDNDRLPSNCDMNSSVSGNQKCLNWICPGLANQQPPTLDWSVSPNNFNTTFLTYDQVAMGTHSEALLGQYVSSQVKIFVCPADNYLSPLQRVVAGASLAKYGLSSRIRTCAMDGAMGNGSKYYAAGQPGHGTMPAYYDVIKMSDMHWPGPADCWVVTDEHPDYNDDCCFFANPADASGLNGSGWDGKFTELPGSLHAKSAGIFFADGHSEMHKWRGSTDTPPVTYQASPPANLNVSSTDPAAISDLVWFASHTPAR